MKKAEYYINVILGENYKEYPKVSGYVEEIEDSKGNVIKVGFHKEKSKWIATELHTGFNCNKTSCNSRSECVEDVRKNIDTIAEAYSAVLNGEYNEKYVKPFRQFVNVNEFVRDNKEKF